MIATAREILSDLAPLIAVLAIVAAAWAITGENPIELVRTIDSAIFNAL